jgi:hypothetical protein
MEIIKTKKLLISDLKSSVNNVRSIRVIYNGKRYSFYVSESLNRKELLLDIMKRICREDAGKELDGCSNDIRVKKD